jgi:hypothetical protein
MDEKSLSESGICAKFITPALQAAGWDEAVQIRREVTYTSGRIVVRGKMVSQGKGFAFVARQQRNPRTASKYKLVLPSEEELCHELDRERGVLEAREGWV